MARYPVSIERLLDQLTRLPGIGRRGATRIAEYLLEAPRGQARDLAEALARLRDEVRACRQCGAWAEAELCAICGDERRRGERICVVEHPPDIYAFEESGAFDGRYHVLGGTLSPLDGIGPDDLNIDRLEERVREEGTEEVILALSPSVQGDATAMYLAEALGRLGVGVTRIGLGLPLGANLNYADPGTLKLALEGRRKMS